MVLILAKVGENPKFPCTSRDLRGHFWRVGTRGVRWRGGCAVSLGRASGVASRRVACSPRGLGRSAGQGNEGERPIRPRLRVPGSPCAVSAQRGARVGAGRACFGTPRGRSAGPSEALCRTAPDWPRKARLIRGGSRPGQRRPGRRCYGTRTAVAHAERPLERAAPGSDARDEARRHGGATTAAPPRRLLPLSMKEGLVSSIGFGVFGFSVGSRVRAGCSSLYRVLAAGAAGRAG